MAGLGQVLREAREQRGMSLAEAEKATKVRKAYLAALEEEDYSALPPPVFIRGYLRSYARYLGIDPEMLLLLYPHRESLPTRPRRERRRLTIPAPTRGLLYALGSLGAAVVVALLLMRWLESGEPAPTMGLVLEVTTRVPAATAALPTVSTSPPTALPTAGAAPPAGATPPPPPTATAAPPQGLVGALGGAMPAEWVSVPSVTGEARSAAEKALSEAGLQAVVTERWNPQVPAGQVVSQDPPAGSEVARGTEVSLVVSLGAEMAVVPRLYGLQEEEAIGLIREAGLVPTKWVDYQGHDSLPDEILSRVCIGCVLSSLPSPGSVVPAGTEIFYAVRAD